jgi:SAM-dependent methyltransferase
MNLNIDTSMNTIQRNSLPMNKPNSLQTSERSKWNNDENQHFYEGIKAHELAHLAHLVGIDTNCDLTLIDDYLKSANAILEVGCGYGRVISYLLEKNYTAKITAIEKTENFFQYTRKKFPQIEILKQDINAFSTQKKFDLILWLWGGISDFGKHEQAIATHNLAKNLSQHGTLVIDTLDLDDEAFSKPWKNEYHSELLGQFLSIDKPYGGAHTYIPSEKEIAIYLTHTKLISSKKIKYQTPEGRPRILYLCKRHA